MNLREPRLWPAQLGPYSGRTRFTVASAIVSAMTIGDSPGASGDHADRHRRHGSMATNRADRLAMSAASRLIYRESVCAIRDALRCAPDRA